MVSLLCFRQCSLFPDLALEKKQNVIEAFNAEDKGKLLDVVF